jgi:hypothetical protein
MVCTSDLGDASRKGWIGMTLEEYGYPWILPKLTTGAFFPGIDLSFAPMALTSVLEGAIPMGKIHGKEILLFLINFVHQKIISHNISLFQNEFWYIQNGLGSMERNMDTIRRN